MHYRRMRRGDVASVVRLLVPDASEEVCQSLRDRLRDTLHSRSQTLVVIAHHIHPQSKMRVVGVAVLHRLFVLSPELDGRVGMLSIHAADGEDDFYVDAVFEGLFQEMRERASTDRWACRIEELGEGLTFV